MEDNIAFLNGSSGFRVDVTTKAAVYITNNTSYGNNGDPYMNSGECGEITLQQSTGIHVTNNLARTKSASGCGSNPNYAFYVASGDSTDDIYSNFGYAMNGQYSGAGGSPSFSYGSNTFGTDPQFANAPEINPGPPSCSGSTNVTNCMADTISEFTPQNPAATSFGYRSPTTVVANDPLFPSWVCNANVPSGLIPNHC